MNLQTQNIFRTTFPVSDDECVGRYLTSVYAIPNNQGGCNVINLSFHYTGWQAGDPLEIYQWDFNNSAEVFIIDSCIDLTTLTYNCIGRIAFTWDDNVDCCP